MTDLEKEKRKILISLGIGFAVLYIILDKKNFIYLSVLSIFLSITKTRISFEVVDCLKKIFNFIRNLLFEILIFSLYFLVLFPVSLFWRFLNREKFNYFFRNDKETFFSEVKEKINFNNQW
ncbi:MAG: hypothetical protein ACP5SD_00025 [Elusimicrobiales bacterium]